jgi:hypothetical protein
MFERNKIHACTADVMQFHLWIPAVEKTLVELLTPLFNWQDLVDYLDSLCGYHELAVRCVFRSAGFRRLVHHRCDKSFARFTVGRISDCDFDGRSHKKAFDRDPIVLEFDGLGRTISCSKLRRCLRGSNYCCKSKPQPATTWCE